MGKCRPLQIGCVADDFTGAGDVASFIAKNEARCLLINGVPTEKEIPAEYDAIVIALKSRSVPAAQAVAQTQKAFDWLRSRGAKTLYFKYCSTFDSTREGNIGPVLDNLLERYEIPYTILCPALPINRRQVRDGILYVNEVPLAESPMRHHPLNPMWHSDISVLMESQSKYRCYKLTSPMMKMPAEAIFRQIALWKAENPHFYIVTDYWTEQDGKRIAELFGGIPLLSGGSSLPQYLMRAHNAAQECKQQTMILAGSCSEMTLRQIDFFLRNGGCALRIRPEEVLSGRQTEEQIWSFVREHPDRNVLLYSSQSHDDILANGTYSQTEISEVLETLMARLGRKAVEEGIRHIVVAGGETSGAVMQALHENAFEIGATVAPGVPVLLPLGAKDVQLVLKSGNFGQEDFFERAINVMESGGG